VTGEFKHDDSIAWATCSFFGEVGDSKLLKFAFDSPRRDYVVFWYRAANIYQHAEVVFADCAKNSAILSKIPAKNL